LGSTSADVVREIYMPGQAARTARIVAAQGSAASVCLPSSSNGCTCTDCAPAFTAANASAAIWAGV
jgi:hypothetical protein